LQPLSPVLHPPFPLQEFLPLQECLSVLGSSKLDEDAKPIAREMLFAPELVLVVEAESVVVVPARSPDMAAVINRDFIVVLVTGVFLSDEVRCAKWAIGVSSPMEFGSLRTCNPSLGEKMPMEMNGVCRIVVRII